MSTRALAVTLTALGLLVVVAAGATRAHYPVAGSGEAPCPDRVWTSALRGLPDAATDVESACTLRSQQRLFVVASSLMGLVIVSGLLVRRRQ
jgi:hypothetical protein